ncbi:MULTISPECIES: hypothetical protein [unclassified Agrococcus]|uniref:hypothetical protein n=1 Tax=unclassified Agrococcus TaxID=2615065 RepID=UPI00361F6ACA
MSAHTFVVQPYDAATLDVERHRAVAASIVLHGGDTRVRATTAEVAAMSGPAVVERADGSATLTFTLGSGS